ncbi:hypothetical protein [Microbacterium sp. LMI1-1-1.1]|uniref:hypothetical protein n=1 Tax=Microbacterium sp. LMI1-1-1.1 TaxID=3135223 RepID=UPI003467A25C
MTERADLDDLLQPDDGREDAASPSPTRRRSLIAVGGVLIAAGLVAGAWAVLGAGGGAPLALATPGASSPAAGPSPSGTPVDSATPGESASPSTAPEAAPEAAAPPVAASAAAPTIPVFEADTVAVSCPDERESTVPLTFRWSSDGAERAWIGIATSDASVQPFAEVPLTADGYTDIAYACRDADQVYTLTVQGSGGTTSSTVAVSRASS